MLLSPRTSEIGILDPIDKVRRSLYEDYLRELERIQGYPYPESEEEQATWVNPYLEKPWYFWIDLFGPEGPAADPVGFLVIAEPPECHPDANYFIVQAYVAPSYRRRGILKAEMKDWESCHPGTYCLDVIKTNEIAKNVWTNIFTDLGYVPVELRKVPRGIDESSLDLFGFGPPDWRC